MARYSHLGDGSRLEESALLFEPEAPFEMGSSPSTVVGRTAIVELLTTAATKHGSRLHMTGSRHHVNNLAIEFESPTWAGRPPGWGSPAKACSGGSMSTSRMPTPRVTMAGGDSLDGGREPIEIRRPSDLAGRRVEALCWLVRVRTGPPVVAEALVRRPIVPFSCDGDPTKRCSLVEMQPI